MLPSKLQLSPDATEGSELVSEPVAPIGKAGQDKDKTSAEVVRKGKSAAEVKLEKRNAELEDELGGLKAKNSELENLLTATKKIPSAKGGGKTVHDEISEFFGWGSK